MREPLTSLGELERGKFEFTTWEGFAVTPNELTIILNSLAESKTPERLRLLAKNGANLANNQGDFNLLNLLSIQAAGTRIDGLAFFLSSLSAGRYPSALSERVRNMGEQEGIMFSNLTGIKIENGRVTETRRLPEKELMEMLKTANVYGLDAAEIDAIYPLVFPEIRSSELAMTLLCNCVHRGLEISEELKQAFQYEGDSLWEYLKLIPLQRSGIRWGIGIDVLKSSDFTFAYGHIHDREFEVRGPDGFIPADKILFLVTKANTLERKLVELCEKSAV